jgi:hypothetical protein
MKKEEARCELSSQRWESSAHAACDIEYADCEENRFCHESIRRWKQERNAICQ